MLDRIGNLRVVSTNPKDPSVAIVTIVIRIKYAIQYTPEEDFTSEHMARRMPKFVPGPSCPQHPGQTAARQA